MTEINATLENAAPNLKGWKCALCFNVSRPVFSTLAFLTVPRFPFPHFSFDSRTRHIRSFAIKRRLTFTIDTDTENGHGQTESL